MTTSFDVIDAAAGLVPGMPLHTARRLRDTAVQATQASHDVLLWDPVQGLSTADRLRVAVHACRAVGADELAAHYATLLEVQAVPPSAALPSMLHFTTLLSIDPRQGDRTAIQALKVAGLGDAAIVALAQLVAFVSYQIRVVAGLKAMRGVA